MLHFTKNLLNFLIFLFFNLVVISVASSSKQASIYTVIDLRFIGLFENQTIPVSDFGVTKFILTQHQTYVRDRNKRIQQLEKKMRGSVDWQSAELVKAIFVEGAKKEERIDPCHPNHKCVASFKTMETYRSVWNNAGHWMKEFYSIKDFEQITAEHIEAYMLYKIEYYPSKLYLQKISASLGKLEIALKCYTLKKYGEPRDFDFGVRQIQLNLARNLNHVYDGYHTRVYKEPEKLIAILVNPKHILSAKMQLHGLARAEGCTLIRHQQMHGYRMDSITQKEVGVIQTREKGGKIGDVFVDIDTYRQIEEIIKREGRFRINYKSYAEDIRNACATLQIECHGSHGFRWTAAQRRVREYQKAGYLYEEALQGVSWEMKHFRSSITEHYLR